jgi:multiple antibiotic resistance protein
MIDLLPFFVYFFAVIDPIGTVPVFIAVTSRLDTRTKRKVALVASLVSSVILIFFVIAGEFILTSMGIPLSAFQIAGGIVLFLFALTMIFGESKPEEEVKLAEDHMDTAIFPLAVPSIAGPGAMLAAVLLTENSRYSVIEQAQISIAMLGVVFVSYLLMLAAGWVHGIIGTSGASVISRVMGIILAAIATSSTLAGIKIYFQL